MGYIGLGICLGIFAGMFGVGGSLIATPILAMFYGLADIVAVATPLPVTIPAAVSSVYGYWQRDLIKKNIAVLTILTGLPFTLLGAYVTKFIDGSSLMILTGLMLLVSGIRMLWRSEASALSMPTYSTAQRNVLTLCIGAVAGFVSGLLAIGGGIIMVPAYVMLLGLSMQQATSTSLLCIAFLAVPGTLVHAVLGHIDWSVVLYMTCGIVPGGYLGSLIAVRTKSEHLQTLFGLILVVFSVYFVVVKGLP